MGLFDGVRALAERGWVIRISLSNGRVHEILVPQEKVGKVVQQIVVDFPDATVTCEVLK